MPCWIDFTVQTLQETLLSGNTDLNFFPMGLSNAHVLHKLVKKTFVSFSIDVPFIKFKNMQDKKCCSLIQTLLGKETSILLCHFSPRSIKVEHAIVLHLRLHVVQGVLDFFIHMMKKSIYAAFLCLEKKFRVLKVCNWTIHGQSQTFNWTKAGFKNSSLEKFSTEDVKIK